MRKKRALALLALRALMGCAETPGSLGEECLRDQDCLSNVCASRVCVATRPTTPNFPAPFDAGTAVVLDSGAADSARD